MSIAHQIPVSELNLDLKNFRTVPQSNEEDAINSLISIEPDWFWGLLESMLDDGYIPTENIIVIKEGNRFIVKEGNRRIASLKIANGLVSDIDIPPNLAQKIKQLSSGWKKLNKSVPCLVYEKADRAIVDKIVSRTHAKGEKAGRAAWNAVAKARYARDQNGQAEPALDLLEKYLEKAKNKSAQQAERWAGDYPITVLSEALGKLASALGYKAIAELVAAYPKKYKKGLDQILYDIGVSNLGFKDLRTSGQAWMTKYNITVPATHPTATSSPVAAPSGASASTSAGKPSAQTAASNDPKSVKKKLRAFIVRGNGREKIATLKNELIVLKIKDTPHAFCFLLRSVFELSAKSYCKDHKKTGGPSAQKTDGSDKHLVDVLREITNYITKNQTDKTKIKLLHGAMAELGKKNGILSVTSLNQLVHNPTFSISPPDICILFNNVFPLIEEMNG